MAMSKTVCQWGVVSREGVHLTFLVDTILICHASLIDVTNTDCCYFVTPNPHFFLRTAAWLDAHSRFIHISV